METLFAPWRFEYVTSVDQRDREACIFCRALSSERDRDTLTLKHDVARLHQSELGDLIEALPASRIRWPATITVAR